MNSNNKMIISLMAEYKKSVSELSAVIQDISNKEFVEIKDKNTSNKDCESIQSLAFHIIQSGHTYANYFFSLTSNKWKEYDIEIPDSTVAIEELNMMLKYTEDSIAELYLKTNQELARYSIEARWGVTFNFEQLFSHAIVHVLRHRRQIEQFLQH